MIYTTCVFIYCQALIKSGPGKRHKLLLGALCFYAFLFTTVYLVNFNPLIMEFMYAFLVFILLGQSCLLLYQNFDRPSMKVFIVGIIMYAIAFIVWNIDNHFCPQLEEF